MEKTQQVLPQLSEKARKKQHTNAASDIKNHLETQGEINLTKAKSTPFKGNLDKTSTKGTISLLKKLI